MFCPDTPGAAPHGNVNEWKKLGTVSPGFFVGRSELTAIGQPFACVARTIVPLAGNQEGLVAI